MVSLIDDQNVYSVTSLNRLNFQADKSDFIKIGCVCHL